MSWHILSYKINTVHRVCSITIGPLTCSAVWYKIKFGSQILATNFAVFFLIYVMFSKIGSMWL